MQLSVAVIIGAFKGILQMVFGLVFWRMNIYNIIIVVSLFPDLKLVSHQNEENYFQYFWFLGGSGRWRWETEEISGDFHHYGHFCGLKIIRRAIAYFGIDAMFSQSAGFWGLGWGWRMSSLLPVLRRGEVRATSAVFWNVFLVHHFKTFSPPTC